MFTAFSRFHAGAAQGEGIGLALVRRMVERHGGRIWLESSPGVGTTFFVALPAAPDDGDASGNGPPTAGRGRGAATRSTRTTRRSQLMGTEPLLIVLAEDDDGHASLVQRNLERAGLANGLERVKDGQEALDFVRGEGDFAGRNTSQQPVLLLLDIKMPRVDGVEVLRQIKADPRTALIPVIMLTTTDDPREIQRCYELGCSVYITKPVDYQGFVEAIKRLGLFLQVVRVPENGWQSGGPGPPGHRGRRMATAASAGKTILLVEDDPGVARLEQLRLERAGYDVATAATAEEGLNRVAGGGIDLIVLDQQLAAGISGLEFFRQVKAAGHNVPAILVTGMQEEGLLVEALRAGVRDFVPKTPNFLNHLEPIVARVLDQVRTERELAESRVVARANEERRRELEREIARRKRVEQALRKAEENLRRMVESVKDVAIFTVDPHGRVASWNPGAEQLFGYAEPEVLGQGIAVIFTARGPRRRRPRAELATAAARGARPTSGGTCARTAAASSPAA